jgi:hypothetical protein
MSDQVVEPRPHCTGKVDTGELGCPATKKKRKPISAATKLADFVTQPDLIRAKGDACAPSPGRRGSDWRVPAFSPIPSVQTQAHDSTTRSRRMG